MSEQRYTFVPDPWAAEFIPSRMVNVPISWLPRRGDGSYVFIVIKRGDSNITHSNGPNVPTLETWRDDLRNGWHVVPEGVRYVAVKGRIEGQRHAGLGFCKEEHALAYIPKLDGPHGSTTWTTEVHPFFVSEWCILDLHDLGGKRTQELPEIAKPQVHDETDDAEIVAHWEEYIRLCEGSAPAMRNLKKGYTTLEVRGTMTTMAEYQAARSRELKRKQAEAREAERQRVVCEGTLSEDY